MAIFSPKDHFACHSKLSSIISSKGVNKVCKNHSGIVLRSCWIPLTHKVVDLNLLRGWSSWTFHRATASPQLFFVMSLPFHNAKNQEAFVDS
jgi:hypothetical protein